MRVRAIFSRSSVRVVTTYSSPTPLSRTVRKHGIQREAPAPALPSSSSPSLRLISGPLVTSTSGSTSHDPEVAESHRQYMAVGTSVPEMARNGPP
jgi:hypothetical protein